MRSKTGLIVLLIAVASSYAQDAADTPEAAADKVSAAFAANDETTLRALASRNGPDPWLVADELCFRGEHDAALAFGRSAARKDLERLPAYVEARRKAGSNAAARKMRVAAAAALRGRKPLDVVRLSNGVQADDVESVRLLWLRAAACAAMRRHDVAEKAYLAAAAGAEKLGWLARASGAWANAGSSAYARRDWKATLAAWERALALHESRGDTRAVATSLGNIGIIHAIQGNLKLALEVQTRALAMKREVGDRIGEAKTLGNIGSLHEHLGDLDKALDCQKRAIALMEKHGDRVAVARSIWNVANIHRRRGNHEAALRSNESALRIWEQLNDQNGVAVSCEKLGKCYSSLGNHTEALRFHERALGLRDARGDRRGVAGSHMHVGVAYGHLGDVGKAMGHLNKAIVICRETGDRPAEFDCLTQLANMHFQRGEFAQALRRHEQVLAFCESNNHRGGVAASLAGIGSIHFRVGDFARAIEYQKRALAIEEELKDKVAMAVTLQNLGIAHYRLEEHAKALAYLQRAATLTDPAGQGHLLLNLSNVYGRLGEDAKAHDCLTRALAVMEARKQRNGVLMALGNLGTSYQRRGNHAKALEYLTRARTMATEIGSLHAEVRFGAALVSLHRAAGRHAEAVRLARAAIDKLPLLVGGLAEEQAAIARSHWVGLLWNGGVRAALALDDTAQVSFFLESGRAGALLESMGGRKAMGGRAIPSELREAEQAAHAAVVETRATLGRAVSGGKRKEIRAARSRLEAAEKAGLEAVARIQRAAKAVADVTYPKADELAAIQERLKANEALVSYGVLSDETIALVVTRDKTRHLRLGKVDETLLFEDRSAPWEAAAERLRKALVKPLGLSPKITRLLVSPAGALSYVPFGVLAPEFEVAYVPSGTTYGVLLEERAARGTRVIALGDPDYGVKREPGGVSLYRSAERGGLARLPATRDEATAIGDVVLLGADASEAKLEEVLRTSDRWRAIHFACHGLLNAANPQLSSLALTPDKDNDGFLTVLEVFQAKIPADLVVLSACETARGEVHRSEGIVGFTRAFMLAGAPRVIVSLWKVDDEATQALMAKFYESWKTQPVAAALKTAQVHVRSQKKWAHPFYWAAWQLWGLAD